MMIKAIFKAITQEATYRILISNSKKKCSAFVVHVYFLKRTSASGVDSKTRGSKKSRRISEATSSLFSVPDYLIPPPAPN